MISRFFLPETTARASGAVAPRSSAQRGQRRLGCAIARARQRAGLSQQQLAALVNIGQGALSRIESGVKPPSVAKLRALAAALGVRAGDLLNESEQLEAAS